MEVNDLRGLRNNFWFVFIPHARNEEHDVVGPMGGTTSASVRLTVCVLKCSSTVANLTASEDSTGPMHKTVFVNYATLCISSAMEQTGEWATVALSASPKILKST